MGTASWKTRDETFHGSKWGYVVVALVIIAVLALLGSIFYLMGEGMKNMNLDSQAIFSYSALTVIIILLIVFALFMLAKVGIIAISVVSGIFSPLYAFLAWIWGIIWTLFSNVYLLVLTVALIVIIITGLVMAVTAQVEINLTNPLVIGLLIVLLILFFPFAIFLIDLFSYEHE